MFASNADYTPADEEFKHQSLPNVLASHYLLMNYSLEVDLKIYSLIKYSRFQQ